MYQVPIVPTESFIYEKIRKNEPMDQDILSEIIWKGQLVHTLKTVKTLMAKNYVTYNSNFDVVTSGKEF